MMALLLLSIASAASQSMLCEPQGPDQALVDALAVCRTLSYGYCINRQQSLSTEISRLALEQDANLALRYQEVAGSQSPRCVNAWINMACSQTFQVDRPGGQEVCEDVCSAVRRHCIGISCNSAAQSPSCTDYYAESSDICDGAIESGDDFDGVMQDDDDGLGGLFGRFGDFPRDFAGGNRILTENSLNFLFLALLLIG